MNWELAKQELKKGKKVFLRSFPEIIYFINNSSMFIQWEGYGYKPEDATFCLTDLDADDWEVCE